MSPIDDKASSFQRPRRPEDLDSTRLRPMAWVLRALRLRGTRLAAIPDRRTVRLAVALAAHGERALLIEEHGRVRLARHLEAERGQGGLEYVGALARGALILARRR